MQVPSRAELAQAMRQWEEDRKTTSPLPVDGLQEVDNEPADWSVGPMPRWLRRTVTAILVGAAFGVWVTWGDSRWFG